MTPHDLEELDPAAYAWPANGTEAADTPVATWKPLDLAGYLNGTIKPAQARLMARRVHPVLVMADHARHRRRHRGTHGSLTGYAALKA